MLRVSNRPCIRELSPKSFRAAKTRNLIAVLAIALTTLLFTALFTVGLSMNEAFQQSNFRQVGGYVHGGFKYLTEEQFLELRDDPLTIAHLAAQRRNQNDLEIMQDMLAKRATLETDSKENSEADLDFHISIAHACHNSILIDNLLHR